MQNCQLVFFDALPMDLQYDHQQKMLPSNVEATMQSLPTRQRQGKIVYAKDMKCLWCGGKTPIWCKELP
jgi:hypothetical protein